MLPGPLADEALHKRRQMSNQQQHLETCSAARARILQAHTQMRVLRIAKRLFDRHALRIESDDRIAGQVFQCLTGPQQPWFASAARIGANLKGAEFKGVRVNIFVLV